MYIDFAINFTYPWSMTGGFDVYDVSDVLMPGVVQDASVFLNGMCLSARSRPAQTNRLGSQTLKFARRSTLPPSRIGP